MHLHCTEEGSHPGVPVVVLHGGGPGASGLSNFRRNLPAFAERFRSPHPQNPQNPQNPPGTSA